MLGYSSFTFSWRFSHILHSYTHIFYQGHLSKCKHLLPPLMKEYKLKNNKSECSTCLKLFPHQLSVIRHIKSCIGKVKTNYECIISQKQFDYKSKNQKHIKIYSYL